MSGLKYLFVTPENPYTIAQNANPALDVITMFPVGMAYVSSSMKKAGFDVRTLNTNFSKVSIESILPEMILGQNIDVVCTGGTSMDVNEIKRIVEISKGVRPEVKVVVGGAIISADPEPAMRVLGTDIGVIGEGEVTTCELASALNEGRPYGSVPGVISWQGGKLELAKKRSEIVDVDNIPLMDFDGFNYSDWLSINGNIGMVHSARACPFQCTFCFKSTGNRYRQRSLDSIFSEIDYQIERFNIRRISICDELFATDKQRIRDFCERIRPYGKKWCCSLRVNEIDTDLLRLLYDSGCTGVGTGLESGSHEVLQSMRKSVTLEQLENALNVFSDSEIFMLGNLIFGDAAETVETVRESIDLWERYRNRLYINLGVVCSYPGSQIYETACAEGIIPDREKYLLDGVFDINISKMDDSEYYKMYSEITELSYAPQIPAESVELLEVDSEGHCRAQWVCRHCGKAHVLTGTHFLQAPICPCPCGRSNNVELFRGVFCDPVQLMAEVPQDETIAFWGVGSQYCRMARFYDCLQGERFVQVDGSALHQKMTRLGRAIYAPRVIAEMNIDTVIITSPLAKKAILAAISTEYKQVKKIYFPVLGFNEGKYTPVFREISNG